MYRSRAFASVERVDNGFIVRYQAIVRRPKEKDVRKSIAVEKFADAFGKLAPADSELPGAASSIQKAVKQMLNATQFADFPQETERVTLEDRSVFCESIGAVTVAIDAAVKAYDEIIESRHQGEHVEGGYGPDFGLQAMAPW